MVQFQICKDTAQWSRFTAFYIAHRQQIIPEYQVSDALVDVRNYARQGMAAILTDRTDEVVGIGSLILGTAAFSYENKEIAVVGNCYFKEAYQRNRTFLRGLQLLAKELGALDTEVKEVQIPTAAENVYTNRLYQKIADKAYTMETEYGAFHVYTTSYEAFASYCTRF